MNITPEIKTKINELAEIIHYGMFYVTSNERGENGKYLKQDRVSSQASVIGCQAYFFIFKNILNYTDEQLNVLSDNPFEIMCDIVDEFELKNGEVIYDKDKIIKHITIYLEDMIQIENTLVTPSLKDMWCPNW